MNSGRQRSNRLRFDLSESVHGPSFPNATQALTPFDLHDDALHEAVAATRDWLLDQQHADGYWNGELEGDTILESEYILLLFFLRQAGSERATKAANYLRKKQLPEGGWATYPGGPVEISASVKAYLALKITGHDPGSEYMVRARGAVLKAGGVERVNSFTRYYLALLGIISYEHCPAVPPELMLIPRWMPFNIYEMSAWSRTIIVPLSLLWAHRPVAQLPKESGIEELFVVSPDDLPPLSAPSEAGDDEAQRTWFNWSQFFRTLDRFLKILDTLRLRPFRRMAISRATQWMTERFENSDGLGAIFPPIVWSIVALKCIGYEDDSPEVCRCLAELDKLLISDDESIRLEPCKSPVWDTAISTIALREAGVPPNHPGLRRAVSWLLSKEIRTPGDWSLSHVGQEPSGWCFEFNNAFYPDTDDTSMVLMALCRALPAEHGSHWSAEFLLGEWSPHEADKDAAAVVSARSQSVKEAFGDLQAMTGQLTATWRGARWLLAMQGRDGGWGAFDSDNNRELFTRVPFADHNAMIDPSTADLTGRMLEVFADLKLPKDHPHVHRAIEYLWKEQEDDDCWYGRWGVNYLYGTWQVLVGLTAIGIPANDRRIRKAADWLRSKQLQCGGWGESPRSYDDASLRGQGESTPSQTAWALMGLMAAGEADSPAVSRGVQYLMETQNADGTWDENEFTGTGFPKVFYLKYHLYCVYFPLMALARYARLRRAG